MKIYTDIQGKKKMENHVSNKNGKSMFPTKATGIHLNQSCHSVSVVRITILEKLKTKFNNRINRMPYYQRSIKFLLSWTAAFRAPFCQTKAHM